MLDPQQTNRPLLVQLYHRWVEANSYRFARSFAGFTVSTTLLLLAFDVLIFGKNASFFYPFRLAGFLISGGVYLYLVLRRDKLNGKTSREVSLAMVVPVLYYNLMSHYFLVAVPFQKDIISQGNIASMAITALFFCRFDRVQRFVQSVSIGCLVALAITNADVRAQAVTLLLWSVLIFVTVMYMRRDFVQTLYERSQSLSAMLPGKLADYIALANSTYDMNKIFAPRRMHTICVLSDWRNYQNLIKAREPEEISEIFQIFYELVLDELERQVPSGRYYASWTADELFVVFYAEEDCIEENFAQATAFLMAFSTTLSSKIRQKLGFELIYDIGVSSGPGLLGLLGPHRMKKTTVVSWTAGEAKRLETEAKTYRYSSRTKNRFPIVAMDSTVSSYLVMKNRVHVNDLNEVKATAKDIRDSIIFVWQQTAAQEGVAENPAEAPQEPAVPSLKSLQSAA